MSFNKYLLTIIAYFLPLLVGINYFIKYQHRNKVSNSYFHQKLFEIGYFKEKTDPYKKAKILNLHPTNYFSLPLDNKSIVCDVLFVTSALFKLGYIKYPLPL